MSSRARLIIDIIVLAVYAIAANPLVTGLLVHEWASLGIVVVFVVHCAVSSDVIAASFRRRLGSGRGTGRGAVRGVGRGTEHDTGHGTERGTGRGTRFGTGLGTGTILNLILDAAILVCFMVVTVSGLMVSRHILPLFGLVAPGYFFWNPLHSISAKVLLALLLVHIVSHWRWLASLFGRHRKADAAGAEPVGTDRTGEDEG